MTKEEIQQKSSDKLKAIQVLLSQLSVSIEPVQKIDGDGIIRNMIIYKDNEKYPVEVKNEEPKTDVPVVEEKKNA